MKIFKNILEKYLVEASEQIISTNNVLAQKTQVIQEIQNLIANGVDPTLIDSALKPFRYSLDPNTFDIENKETTKLILNKLKELSVD